MFKECNLQLISTFLACGNSSKKKKVNNSSGGEGEGAGAGSGGSSSSYPTIKRSKATTTVGDEHKEGRITLMDTEEATVDQQQQQYKSTNFRSVCCISGVTRLIYAFARELDAGGLWAVSGSSDGTLKVWNLGNYTDMATSGDGYFSVHCCDVFADGTPRVLSSSGNNLKVWH